MPLINGNGSLYLENAEKNATVKGGKGRLKQRRRQSILSVRLRCCGMWNFVWRGNPLSGVAPAKNRARSPTAVPPSLLTASPLLARCLRPLFDARSCLIQRTLTVLTSAESSVLARGASWPLSTAKNPQHRRIEDGTSCGTCQGNRPVETPMLLIAASHTRLVHFDTYWCNARACYGFTSVLFTTRVWIWGSWRNATGLRGFSHVKLLGECLDSLQSIHATGGYLVAC